MRRGPSGLPAVSRSSGATDATSACLSNGRTQLWSGSTGIPARSLCRGQGGRPVLTVLCGVLDPLGDVLWSWVFPGGIYLVIGRASLGWEGCRRDAGGMREGCGRDAGGMREGWGGPAPAWGINDLTLHLA